MESTRLDPPIPVTLFQETIADTKLSNGQRLPKGTLFTFNLYAMHRDPSQYHFPEKFMPERFDRTSDIYLTPGNEQRHPLSWSPFFAGKRQCNGRDFAFKVIKLVTSMYMAAMPDLEFVDPSFGKLEEMPSSNPQSPVTEVLCVAKLPLKI